MDKNEVKALKGRIATAIKNDVSTDTNVHELAVLTLQHASDTGDFTLFARLVGDCQTAGGEKFERGVRSRRIALIEWAAKFSPIRINGDGVMGLMKESAKGYVPFNVDSARANAFWTLESERNRRTQNRVFDLTTISGRLSGIGKAIDKQVEAGTMDDETETLLRDLSVQLNATFAKFVKDRKIDMEAIKKQRDALQAETVPVNDETPATINVGGEAVA